MRTQIDTAPDRRFAFDTTFVLFFLGLELGFSFTGFGIEDILSVFTLAAFIVVPFLLPASGDKPSFGTWLLGRTIVALFSVTLGFAFKYTLGPVLPEMFRFLPMTLLIVAGIGSFYIQFYSMMRYRLAK